MMIMIYIYILKIVKEVDIKLNVIRYGLSYEYHFFLYTTSLASSSRSYLNVGLVRP